jgi:hypothetical protein
MKIHATGDGGGINLASQGGGYWANTIYNDMEVLAKSGPINWTMDESHPNYYASGTDIYLGSKSGVTGLETSSSDITFESSMKTDADAPNAPVYHVASTGDFNLLGVNSTDVFASTVTMNWFSIGENSQRNSSITIGVSSNTSDINFLSDITAAGPITAYGNSIQLQSDLTTTDANAAVKLLAKHTIYSTATNPTITTGTSTITGGNVLFATDTDGNGQGMIEFSNGLNISSHGGDITFGGGDINGSSYTRGYSFRPEGVRIDDSFSLVSDGGDISIRGKSYSGSVTSLISGVVTWYTGTKQLILELEPF